MIKKIRIKNYKAFRDYNEIEIKPITILVGPNSAGKSSLLKLISKLKSRYETILLEELNYNNTTFLSNKNPIEIKIEYGFENKSFISNFYFMENKLNVETTKREEKNNSRNIKKCSKDFSLNYINGSYPVINWDGLIKLAKQNLEHNYRDEIKEINNLLKAFKNGHFLEVWDIIRPIQDIIYEDFIKEDQSNISFNGNPFYIELEDKSEFEVADDILKHCKYEIPEYEQLDFIYKNDKILSKRFNEIEKSIIYDNSTKTRNILLDMLRNIKPQLKYDEILSSKIIVSLCVVIFSARLRYELLKIKKEYLNNIKKIGFGKLTKYSLPKIININPLRGIPRNYYDKRELVENFQIPIEYLDMHNNLNDLQNAVNKLLKRMEINYKLIIKEIRHKNLNERIYAVKLKDIITNYEYNLNELGFGISQILPIISNIYINNRRTYYERRSFDFEFKSNSNIYLVEQPEIHLHPKQQTLLAKLFYELLFDEKLYDQMSDNYLDINEYDGDKVIIETHSEHLIRGLQLLVAQGKIKPEHLGIYYINKNNEGESSIKLMEVNDNGLFKEAWPEGFFDQHYKLAKELLFAKRK